MEELRAKDGGVLGRMKRTTAYQRRRLGRAVVWGSCHVIPGRGLTLEGVEDTDHAELDDELEY